MTNVLNKDWHDLHDRQIRTYGNKANYKINSSSVILVGLSGGIGTEISKNLVLTGIKELFLCYDSCLTSDDIENGFYWNSNDLNKDCLKNKIKELNPYTNVFNYNDILTEEFLRNKVLVVVNKNFEECMKYNKLCEKSNSKLVCIFSSGLSGLIFNYFGSNYKILESNDEIIEPIQISFVLKDGSVRCSKNVVHNLQTGNIIKFKNVVGENVGFLNKEWEIDVTSKNSFLLKDFDSNIDFNFLNGSIIKILKEKVFNSETLNQQLNNKNFNIVGFNDERTIKIINMYNKLLNSNYINPWSSEMDKRILNFDLDISKLIRTFGTEIPPVSSFIGSVASSEIIKMITNKYTPLNQWWSWDDDSLITKGFHPSNNNSKTKLGKLLGTNYIDKLNRLNILMVGCGALGCEWLKIASLLGISTKGEFVITDPDNIEKSNLNRQFLFRPEDIGKPKTISAANNLRKINNSINIIPYTDKVCNENKNNNNLFKDKDIIINALDNIKARKFVDQICLNKNLPLFESGTSGMKGNTQPVIPFLTETYSNSSDPPQEKTFPICTLKNFPNESVHTIHWAVDYFQFFKRGPENINNFRKDINFLDNLSSYEKELAKKDIISFVDNDINSWKDCATWASDIWHDEFVNNITQLLNNFPKDSKNTNGTFFWSAGKRCPNVLRFNLNNKNVVDFLESTTHLLARCSNINDDFKREELIDFLLTYKPKEYNIDLNKKIAKDDSELKNINNDELIKFDKVRIHSLIKYDYTVQNFEKDDDSNYHIKFINSASNCRSDNYDIENTTFQNTKGIAGRIIPAVATTTSAIIGLISLELMKYCMDINDIDSYKSCFINLSDNTHVFASPIVAPMLKIGSRKINSWEKFIFKEDKTLKEFIDVYNNIFNCSINMVLYKSSILFAEFLPSNNLNKRLIDIFMNKFKIDIKNDSTELVIDCSDDFELPTIQVLIK